MIKRQTTLSANLLSFCRYLRERGFNIGPTEEADALQSLTMVASFDDPDSFQLCLQSTLCRSPQQLKLFPDLFHQFWRELDRAVDSSIKNQQEQTDKPRPAANNAPSLHQLKNWLHGNHQKDTQETASYSAYGGAESNTLLQFNERELRDIFKLVQQLIYKIANRRSRRFQKSHRQEQLDLKKTMRYNFTRSSEIIQLKYKRKKQDQVNVILICDVSKSMELYSRFFIQFLYAFQQNFPKVNAFVFSSELHPISKELTHRSLETSLKKIIQKVTYWNGGTQIGQSLQAFNEQYLHKYVRSKTLVMILSDGWDAGAPDLVAEQMKLLHRKALKVLWLNPLAGNADWQPEVRAMKAALPYIDLLVPFYDLDSLRTVVREWR